MDTSMLFNFVLCAVTAQGLKIMILPMNMGSHLLFMGKIGSELMKEGHEVIMYIPDNNKPPHGLSPIPRLVTYKTPYDVPFSHSDVFAQIETRSLLTESSLEWFDIMVELQVHLLESFNRECESLYEHYDEIESENFDIAIMDGIAMACFYTIPYKLKIPWITFSLPYSLWAYRVPQLSSQWPNLGTTSDDNMDFWQRLNAFVLDVMDYTYLNDTDISCRRFVPERDPKGDATLLLESAMWWHFYDISVGYPKPNMPNTLDLGDIIARPAKPLDEEYNSLLTSASDRVVLVSLGSHFDHVPASWLEKFCAAFNSVSYDIIWKMKIQPPCKVNSNVHIKRWIPQNDILAHPKVALFITHCGINSLIESFSHGKPVICLPISLDQPYNAEIVESKGYGESLHFKTFAVDQLVDSITNVIGNGTFSDNVRKASEILFSKPNTPGKRMSFWVEHIVRYGDSHLRTKSHELSLVEFLMFDIFLFLLASLTVSIIILVLTCYYCFKCLRRIVCRKANTIKTQ